MFWQRILFGSLMIAALVGVVVIDGKWSEQMQGLSSYCTDSLCARGMLLRGLPMTLLMLGLLIPAVYELGRLCRLGGYRPAVHWSAFVAVGLAIVPWLEMQYRMAPADGLVPLLSIDLSPSVLWLTGGLLGACLVILARKTTERAISNIAITLFIMIYLGLLGSFAVRIRCLHPGMAGSALIIYFIISVKSGDIGAYFTGRLFGKHKLIPWLSPGKTIEGGIGAIVFAGGVSTGLIALWSYLAADILPLGTPPLQLSQAFVFGALMAVFGHFGDLVESAIKRDVGSKDSGRIIPAFGGLLDLLDSPLVAAPIAWGYLTILGDLG
ncbi:MAG: phosphatidate cytidylyltransferase [Phycisphaerales bacterium]|nr:phosphatidate cytidylyltransferase [Phycisphaerales bacterium]